MEPVSFATCSAFVSQVQVHGLSEVVLYTSLVSKQVSDSNKTSH